MFSRPWAFWRRAQYIAGVLVFFLLIGTGLYFKYGYKAPSCFDGIQNGSEQGIDCGGACTKICAFQVAQPKVLWARSFKVVDGQYNAVAYIQNTNVGIGSPTVSYKFSLYDGQGLITEREGTTVLPPDSVYPIFEGRINTGARVPTQTFITITPPQSWLPAQYGRDQFVVQGRSLTGADSQPRLTAKLTNTALTDSKNVNVVATIFDAHGNALTASQTFVPDFPGRSTQDVVFTWPQPIAKTIRSCEVPTDVVLAIDLSGSMNDDGGNPPQPISSVLAAAESFVGRLKSKDQVGLVTFATTATLNEELTRNTDAAKGIVSGLTIPPANEHGSTNTGDAINTANQELNSSRHNFDARKVLVLLTDGLANAPDPDPEGYALKAAAAIKTSGVEVYTIGLGSKVNADFLRQVASGSDHYYAATSASTIDGIYRSITAAICEDGAAVIDIIPKTGTTFQDQPQ